MFKIGNIVIGRNPSIYNVDINFDKTSGMTAVGIPYGAISSFERRVTLSFDIDELEAHSLIEQIRSEINRSIVILEDMIGVKHRCLVDRFSYSRKSTLVKKDSTNNLVNKALYSANLELMVLR